MQIDLKIFKDYDVRGTYPNQINGEVAKAIAHAIVRKFNPKTIVIGRDMRLSGEEIKNGFTNAFLSLGIDVYDQGLVGTEFMSYVAGTKDYDLVIMISASHNPPEYNGFKMTLKGSISVSIDTGLQDIRDLLSQDLLPEDANHGKITQIDMYPEWKEKILSLVDISNIKLLSVVADAGNGMAGKLIPILFKDLPVKITPLFFELDGSFPNHIPNPLIESNNTSLIKKILEINADLGICFDGDADRMFLIDNKGRFIPGTITAALLARYFLQKYPGELILYNAICGRIVPETIEKYGGSSKRIRVGYSYIKAEMKLTNAILACEHSGHYFYKNYFNAESGVLSALTIMTLLSKENRKLSELVDELDIYPSSGEINFVISDIPKALNNIRTDFTDAVSKDEIDGVSVWYKDYWFNVRASKTEPLLRLNIEADNQEILDQQKTLLISKIESFGGVKK